MLEVIKRNPKEIVLSALLRMSEQMPFYIFTVFVLEYGQDELGFGKTFLTNSVAGAAALALVLVPLFGHLSDRHRTQADVLDRRGADVLLGDPVLPLLDHGSAAIVSLAIVCSLIPHNMQYGPQAALIAETFPTRLRYSGAGMGYQLASVVAGGPAPLIATWLLHTFNSSLPIALYIMAGAVVTLIATALLPRPVAELEQAARPSAPRFVRAEDREPVGVPTEPSSTR